jgi:hypothetical protein
MRDIKTPDEMEAQAIEHNILFWNIRDCSICSAPIGYNFNHTTNKVYFDSSCDCSQSIPKESDWQDVANHYNSKSLSPNFKEVERFWKFNNLDKKVELFNFVFNAGIGEADIKHIKSFYLDEIKPFVFNLMQENPMIAVAINVYAYKGEFEYFVRIVAEVRGGTKYDYVTIPRTFLRKDLLNSNDKMLLNNWLKELTKEKPELDFSGRPPQVTKVQGNGD